ncbi:MAG: methylamine utilization protein [endosymbiont of Galathealinum brachiosum]|uniref:Methylamine utilization protein n=1 Tax=endosymbiont of Galathealinum brachiosum TaxID=2200906 RepID=A0A370D9X9_9GAMM|nr:MAG: methylamine utilization protein [endosymbiont of Galathealinum brachiosum]
MYKQMSLVVLLMSFSTLAFSEEYIVEQKGKVFSVKQLSIKVGDTVSFPNNDPFYHNVFSYSGTKKFDLGSYKKGDTRKVTFNKPGVIEVECAIHPKMHMTINVE